MSQVAVTTILESERRAILRVLAWLSTRDRAVAASKDEFIQQVAFELNVDAGDVEQFVRDLPTEVDAIAPEIYTQTAQDYLLYQLVWLALADRHYDARKRAGIRAIAYAMEVPFSRVERLEQNIAAELLELAYHEADIDPEVKGWTMQRMLKVGGIVAGATSLLAVTGGMAAPAIGSAIGAQFLGFSGSAATAAGLAWLGGGTSAAGGLGVAGGTAIVKGLFGLLGGGMAASKAMHLTGSLKEFEPIHLGGCSTHVCLGISGFLAQNLDFKSSWIKSLAQVFPHADCYALKWEAKTLTDLGNAIADIAAKPAIASFAGQMTSGAWQVGPGGAIALPAAILALLSFIDNPWTVACNRAEQAGQVLGRYILERGFSDRPITLVGFSLGVRAIAYALEYLAEHDGYGLVDSVYMFGGAIATDNPRVDYLTQMTSGHVVNVFSRKDVILNYWYRAMQGFSTAIGLTDLEREGILDYDATDAIGGHFQYPKKLGEILYDVRKHLGETPLITVDIPSVDPEIEAMTALSVEGVF